MKNFIKTVVWFFVGKLKSLTYFPAYTTAEISENPERFIETMKTGAGENELSFYGFGSMTRWRVETLYEKEPETIEWIDQFSEGEVFWDIGANIGVYSLYAGRTKPGLKILAFEPLSSNYYLLSKNINLNGLSGDLAGYNLAFSDATRLGQLNISFGNPGDSLNQFGDALDEVEAGEARFAVSNRQGMVGYTIDDFIRHFDPLFPTRIKIDVDGIEDRIIAGAEKTLADPRVKSVLIEMDEADADYVKRVSENLQRAGLELKYKKREGRFYTGEFASTYNFFYFRN